MPSHIVATVEQTGTSSSEAHIRQHAVVIDRPLAKDGTDQGPMGGELFLASVGGCFLSTLLAAAKARGAALSHARVDVTGTLEQGPSRYVAVDLHVSADTPEEANLAQLVDIANRGCIMTNTIRSMVALTVRSD